MAVLRRCIQIEKYEGFSLNAIYLNYDLYVISRSYSLFLRTPSFLPQNWNFIYFTFQFIFKTKAKYSHWQND